MVKITLATFLEKFRRITSSDNYLPEIDGLRFVAIFAVVVCDHLVKALNDRLYQNKLWNSSYISHVISEGGNGVSLFFMISGFILAIPFIKDNLYNEKPILLKQYYLRRLTRLEPPYLVALFIAYTSFVIIKGYAYSDLLPNLMASAIYMHNLIFVSGSAFLGVAWSLEIEIQFYLLAPLLFTIFFIKNKIWRRSILLSVILFFIIYTWNKMWQLPAMLPYFLCYFLIGVLLADFYCSKHKTILNNRVGQIIGVLLLVGFPFITPVSTFGIFFLKIAILGSIFYLVLFNKYLKINFSNRLITIIGGMCYSIYLMHTMIISFFLTYLRPFSEKPNYFVLIIITILMIIMILTISALFYHFIEQPCMRKDWWKKLFKSLH